MPADPVHREQHKGRPDEHRDEREDAGREPAAAQAEGVREAVEDREEEQRPARLRAGAPVLVSQIDEPGGRSNEDGQPTRVDEEGGCCPDRLRLCLDTVVVVTLLPLAEHPEQDEPEAQEADGERDVPKTVEGRSTAERSRPGRVGHRLDDVVAGRNEEPDRPVKRPARPLRPVRPDDVHERHERDDREVECRVVTPVEDRNPDEVTRRQVQPERRRLVADAPVEEVREPDEERDDRERIAVPLRHEVDDEEGSERRGDAAQVREPEAPAGDGCGEQNQDFEQEPRPRPHLEVAERPVLPAPPVERNDKKDRPRNHRVMGEDPGGNPPVGAP